MADPYVRETGAVLGVDGWVRLGVDYDSVSILIAGQLARLTQDQAELFAHEFVSAVGQAGQQKGLMDAMVSRCSGDCGCRLGTDDTCGEECCYPDSERDADATAHQSGEDPRDGAE